LEIAMPSDEIKTISLPAAEAERIDALIQSGSYASQAEVIHAALQALEERESAVEQWLLEEVAPVYDAYQADPSRGIPAEEVFEELRAHHAAQTQKSA
jgi:antitoxin ParD1/3/4